MSKSKIAILMATSAMSAWPVMALAQAQTAPASDTTIEEVVVTANRVETTAQTTPIALTVYSSQALSQAGVTSVQALQSIDPSVNVTSSTGAAYVAVRGVASTDITEIGDPSVPIARDGFFTNRSYSIGSSMYDLQRVEVLKGPQGTLFGRNSTGGLVSILTKRPGKDFGGYVNLEGGNYNLFSAEGGVNLPVNDRLQFRVSGVARKRDGYRELTPVNQRGDDDKVWSVRLQAAAEPIDGLTAWVSYQHDDVGGVGDVAKSLPLERVTPLGDVKRFAGYVPTMTDLQSDRARWEFVYDQLPGDLTLTYAGGYDASRWKHTLELTPLSGTPKQQFQQSEAPDTWNHEVRIATPQDGRFTLQAGAFFYSEKNTLTSGLQQQSGPYVNRYLIRFNYNTESTSKAVFGQAGFKLSEEIKLTGGARYTWDEKTRTGQADLDLEVASGGFAPPIHIITPGDGHVKQSNPTYHLGIDWTPTSTNLIYAKFDTGYKSGGFNSNGSAPSVDYGPEHLDAFEIGSKNRFLDNKLQLNIDAFTQKYTGYQAAQQTAVISSGSGVFNIGEAKINGVEAQLIAIIDSLGRFDANATWLDAKFKNSVGNVARGDSAGTVANIGGNSLPNAPKLVIAAGFEHAFTVGNATLTARIDGKHSSGFYYSVFNDADTRAHGYTMGNLSLVYEPNGASWTLQGYVRNFTDEVVLTNAARNYNSNNNNYQFAPPRTYGVRLNYTF